MKKYLIGAVAGFMLAIPAYSLADTAIKNVTAQLRPDLPILLNGQKVELKNPPVMIDGSTYLPLRELGTVAGLDVNWNAATQSVELAGGETTGSAAQETAASDATTRNLESEVEILNDYLAQYGLAEHDKTDPAIRYTGEVYLPVSIGSKIYPEVNPIKYDIDTNSMFFEKVNLSVYLNEDLGGDGFYYQGRSYIKDSIFVDVKKKVSP